MRVDYPDWGTNDLDPSNPELSTISVSEALKELEQLGLGVLESEVLDEGQDPCEEELVWRSKVSR